MINSSWIYWISAISCFKGICIGIAIIAFIVFIFCTILMTINIDYLNSSIAKQCADEFKQCMKWFKISIAIMAVSILSIIFIPSKDTLIEMKVADMLMQSNIELSVDTVKETVDYIINALAEIKGVL